MSSVYSMGINLSNHDRSVAICKDGINLRESVNYSDFSYMSSPAILAAL